MLSIISNFLRRMGNHIIRQHCNAIICIVMPCDTFSLEFLKQFPNPQISRLRNLQSSCLNWSMEFYFKYLSESGNPKLIARQHYLVQNPPNCFQNRRIVVIWICCLGKISLFIPHARGCLALLVLWPQQKPIKSISYFVYLFQMQSNFISISIAKFSFIR